MPRAIWKGAIAFGLVHVPVALYPASEESEIDFDWLDKRSMDPVGYKRVNKRTRKEIHKDDVVKGVKQASGDYVILSEDEIKAAYPKTTQTIEIEAFVPAQDISFVYLERPYYLEPVGRSDKAYALLREAMAASSLIGIARLVMHTKEHLAAVLPAGPALMLGTLRWANEIRPASELKFPPAGPGCGPPEGRRAEDGGSADQKHDHHVRSAQVRGQVLRRHSRAHRAQGEGGRIPDRRTAGRSACARVLERHRTERTPAQQPGQAKSGRRRRCAAQARCGKETGGRAQARMTADRPARSASR
jgi:Ku protein